MMKISFPDDCRSPSGGGTSVPTAWRALPSRSQMVPGPDLTDGFRKKLFTISFPRCSNEICSFSFEAKCLLCFETLKLHETSPRSASSKSPEALWWHKSERLRAKQEGPRLPGSFCFDRVTCVTCLTCLAEGSKLQGKYFGW